MLLIKYNIYRVQKFYNQSKTGLCLIIVFFSLFSFSELRVFVNLMYSINKHSIGDAHSPQPGEIVYNTVRYRRSDTVKNQETFSANNVT